MSAILNFAKMSVVIGIATFAPPFAIGIAAVVTREPLLGLITGLVGSFIALWAVRKL